MFQKSKIFIACTLAACATAQAQSADYTLYGKVDAFVEYASGGSDGNRIGLESGGLVGSRWGIKGGRSLDGIAPGTRAIFQLEGGLFVNNGRQAQNNRLFGRQAYAGVEGKYGTLTVGRQYTPLLNTVVTFDAFEQGYGSPANDGQVSYGIDSRYDNAIIYSMPASNGFTGSAMLALGGNTGHTSRNASGFNVGYTAGAFETGFAFQRDDHYLATASAVNNAFLGASYKIGNVKLLAGVGRVDTNLDVGTDTKRNEWMVSSQIGMTATGRLWLTYGTGKTKSSTPSDKSQNASVAWVETVSKDLKVYAVGSVLKNAQGSALAPVGTSSYGGYTVANGDTARSLALGFQYAF